MPSRLKVVLELRGALYKGSVSAFDALNYHSRSHKILLNRKVIQSKEVPFMFSKNTKLRKLIQAFEFLRERAKISSAVNEWFIPSFLRIYREKRGTGAGHSEYKKILKEYGIRKPAKIVEEAVEAPSSQGWGAPFVHPTPNHPTETRNARIQRVLGTLLPRRIDPTTRG